MKMMVNSGHEEEMDERKMTVDENEKWTEGQMKMKAMNMKSNEGVV